MLNRLIILSTVTCVLLFVATLAVAGLNDCGQPASTGSTPTATDALYTLRAAIGTAPCDITVCDVDSTCIITATDALALLRVATGQPYDLVCAQGCFGSTTSTSSTVPYVSTTTTTLVPSATWTDVLAVIAAHGCASAGCHGSAGISANLSNLDDYDLGYDELVGASVDCSSSTFGVRVLPGDPSSSFIVAKLEGIQDCGSQMPLGGPYLSNEEIQTIVSWIASGAPKN